MNITRPSFGLQLNHSLAAARRGACAMLGGALIAATAFVGSAGVAGAATGGPVTEVITMSGPVRLIPAGRFVVVADTCTVQVGTEAPAPCSFVGTGTVTPSGGEGRGVVTSRYGVTILNETYVFTGPTTAHGTGTSLSIQRGAPATGTFTADLTTLPTGDPSVLSQSGTITVRAD